MPIIGPSFDAELAAAGVTEKRFSRPGPGVDGALLFHPDVPDSERDKVLAVLAAHDGPLSEARHKALQATNAEAARRIAEMFLREPDTFKLIYAEMNALAKAVQILDKKIDGTALPEEWLAFEELGGLYDRVTAIRQVNDGAEAALKAAKSVEDVQAVKVGWPGE